MRAVIDTLAPIFGEKGTKTIEDLKILIIVMEEENIKLFNEKTQFNKYSQKSFQNSKYLEVVFQITIDDLKQTILQKEEEILNFLMKIKKYKCNNVNTLQSQIQKSVENKEAHEEIQGQAKYESRKASAPGFSAPDPTTGPEAPSKEILPIPI